MRPFFRYFGSKWKLARHLGPPQRPVVVEPFAGAAGYSVYWSVPKTILVEKDPRVAAVWRWLIAAGRADVMALNPALDDLRDCGYPPPVRDLIGSWFGRGSHGRPMTRMPPSIRAQRDGSGRFWGAAVRDRLAAQIHLIDNWEIIEGGYAAAPDLEAHWHIDPPYQRRQHHYPGACVDHAELAGWCKSRRGSGEVCEYAGADWLPFEPLQTRRSQINRPYTEVVHRLCA